MFPKHLKLPLILLCSFAFLLVLIPTVQAAQASILPPCVSEGYCTLCDIMQLVINFGKFLLGIVGSLALLMFVYGGFVWLTSGGESGKIDAGKKILINSVIGVAITFFAWVIVAFVVSTLTTGNASFKWDTTLSCAPLLGLEQPDVDLERLNSTIGAGGGSGTPTGTKKEEEKCTASAECMTGLYCRKGTTNCQKKLLTSNESKYACVNMEISGQDDLACESGTCGSALRIIPGGCDAGQCCGKGGTQTAGTECVAQNCAKGLFCSKITEGKGKCIVQSKVDALCSATEAVNGTANDVCESGNCKDGKCAPGYTPTGTIGAKCVASSGCRPELYCKGATTGAKEGTCAPDLTIGQSCIDAVTKAIPGEYAGGDSDTCGIDGTCNLGSHKCTNSKGTAKVGEYCTMAGQCSTKSCKCPGDDEKGSRSSGCGEGTCETKIIKGDTTRFCKGWEASTGLSDNDRCATGDCLNLWGDELYGKCDTK